jgi:hypothetical protein
MKTKGYTLLILVIYLNTGDDEGGGDSRCGGVIRHKEHGGAMGGWYPKKPHGC